jgi:hypothetical protein
MGGVMVRPVTGERARDDVSHFAGMLSLAAPLLAVGLWCAIWRSHSLHGEALYLRTTHWFESGENAANGVFASAEAEATSAANRPGQIEFAERLEFYVIPFWREANARTHAVDLDPDSPSLSALQLIRSVSASRLTAFQDYAAGLRAADPAEVAKAKMELANGNHEVDDWLAQHGSGR